MGIMDENTAMSTIREFLLHEWMKLVVPLGALVVTLAIGYAAKRILERALSAWTARLKSPAAAMAASAILGPFMVWVLILAIRLAMESSELPPRVTLWAGRILLALWILSFTIIATRLAGELIRYYGQDVQGVLPVTTLTQNLAQLAVVILGLMVLLNQLGFDITAMLTALGVGGLAVALALQDTLSNLFAGFYISVSRQVRLGDYIKLSTGEEGYVADITWRSTSIRALSNNLIIVPNAKLGQAVVTNYHLPEKRMSVLIQVGVGYNSDPEHVERVLVEEAKRAAGEVPGLLAEPAPFVRFDPGFGESALGFTLICQVAEFVDQYLVRHELRKRIFLRLRKEGIEIPFPTRTLYVRERGA
jgi:small-conductance mechanosensitive channel